MMPATKERRAAYMRGWRKRSGKERAYMLRCRFGIELADWDAMLVSQGGCCAICGNEDPGAPNWHTDHDHETGIFRGILCRGCNTSLGNMNDDPDRLRAAADYLERHSE